MKKFLLFIIVVLAIFFGYRWVSSPAIEESTPLPVVIIDGKDGSKLQTTTIDTPTPAATPSAEQPTAVTASSDGIRLSSPSADSAVSSPVRIAGEVSAAHSTLGVRIKNTKGETLIEEAVRVRKGVDGAPGTFEVNIQYQFSTTKEGSIEVSAEGGADAVSVPVRFE